MKSRIIQKRKGKTVEEPSILIVEDDFIVAKVIEKSLLELGYHIAGMVGTGRDAIVTAEREQPDLVLMDISLQGDMDGITAAGEIHSRYKIPVVFLTAFSDKTTFSRALKTAPYGYIIKPFQTNTLATTIQVALNKYRLEEQMESRNTWLTGALQSLSEGIMTVDTAGSITLINAVAERMTGYTADEVYGQPIGRILLFKDPVTRRKGTIATAPVLTEGVITTVPEGSLLLAKNGSTIPVSEVIASPVKNDAGAITGAAIVIYPEEAKPVFSRPSAPAAAQQPTTPPLTGTLQPEKSRKKKPVSTDDWIDRGNSLVFLRRYDDAVGAYDRAIAINPTNYQAWYGKGTALSKTGNPDAALAAYDHALSIHPRNPQVLMAKGVLLRKAGNEEEASRCFELANLYTS